MKFTHEQRMEMAYFGVDPDQMENPKQELPTVDQRINKMKRYIEEGHPDSKEYKEKIKVYQVLKGEAPKKNRNFFKKIFGG